MNRGDMFINEYGNKNDPVALILALTVAERRLRGFGLVLCQLSLTRILRQVSRARLEQEVKDVLG